MVTDGNVKVKRNRANQNGVAPPAAGRPKGGINKLTSIAHERITATGQTPLDYLISVMRDKTKSDAARTDAAKAAAPYVHARLSAIEHAGAGGGPLTVQWLLPGETVKPEPIALEATTEAAGTCPALPPS